MWRKNNSVHITSWFVITRVTWKVMWQMELQTFVAITCHATLSAELRARGPIFSLISVCLAGSVPLYQPAWFQHLLGLLSLECRGLEWGAWRLPVYSEGFLHCSPSSPPQLPLKDFSHFCARCCFGNRSRARHMGASRGIPESLSGSGSAGILSYSTYRLFRTHLRYFYSRKTKQYDRVSSLYPFILSWNLITFVYSFWFFNFSPRFTVEWSYPSSTNPSRDRNRLSFGNCYATSW